MIGIREKVQELSQAALSVAAIAKELGISKQRVYQILHPRPKREKSALEAKRMLRAGEAAQLLGVHTNTVRRWGDAGILKVYRISARGDRRFRRKDIEHFLKGSRRVA